MAVVQGGAKKKRDRVYVQIVGQDNTPLFVDATEHLGSPIPFSKWVATCAMRAQSDIVAFSWLQPSKVARKKIAVEPLTIPHSSILRTARQAREFLDAEKIPQGQMLVELDGTTYLLDVFIDDARSLRLEMHGQDDVVFELPTRAVRMSVYFHSPVVNRVVAASFISFPGKPGKPDSVVHVASKNLHAICGLAEWRVLAGFDSVKVGAAPSSGPRRTLAKREVKVDVPVRFYPDPPTAPVAAGSITVSVDLETVSHVPGRLVIGFEPSEAVAALWDAYRVCADNAVHSVLTAALGGHDQVSMLQYDIVLGEVSDGHISDLTDALRGLASLELTPTQFQAVPAA